MALTSETKSFVFRFADFTVHEREFVVVKAGQVQQVEPKVFRVLLMLIRNPNKLITKAELMSSVWGDTAVTENSLTRNIALLRRLLGDDPREPHFIETVSGIGYRWICPEGCVADPAAAATDPEETDTEPAEARKGAAYFAQAMSAQVKAASRSPWAWGALAGAAALTVLLVACWYLSRPLPAPRITAITQLTFDGGQKDLAGTDGLRIYFNREKTMLRSVFAVPSAGGASTAIPIAIPENVHLEDVSADGANLLVNTDKYGLSNERPQWIVRALDGVPLHPLPDGVSSVLSPDGRFVIYSTHDGSIWLVGRDGEGAHKIALAEGAWGFAWSPDGGRIRFNKGSGQLWEMTSSGLKPHQLLADWHDSPWQCCGHWTADGSLFVFRSQEKGAISPEIWAMDERRGIFRHPPQTPVRLAPGPIRWTSVLPAKDAKTLYATGEVLRGELLRFDSRTRQFQPFLGGISAQGPRFSPDGRFVVYVSWPDAFLFRANADGSNSVQLTDSRFAPFRPTWSPDGTQILFEDQRSELSAIYLIPASGGVAQRVIPGGREPENDPTWSADGKKIAFAVQLSERAKYHLRVVDLTTHTVSDLPGSMGIYGPRWSPDGRYISALTHDGLNLKVFDTITLRWKTVVQNMFAAYPQWSRDGHWLYFENADLSDKYSIRRVRVSGGRPEVVAVLPGVNAAGWWGWFGLDATDAPLIMRDIGRHEIYALTLDMK